MRLEINKNVSTDDVKTLFKDSFDGLKIEFFKHSHAHEQGSPKKDMVRGLISLGELNSELPVTVIDIEGEMTVNQVEDLFETKLGLHIQVFRKMNISWIETTATDSFTLDRQVRMSKESRGY